MATAAPAAPAAPAPAAPAAPAPGTPAAPAAAPAAPEAGVEAVWRDDWRTQIAGDDASISKRLERYATPKDVANALLSVQQRIGAGELRSVLPKNATPEQVTQWRTEVGIPETPDKYALTLKDGRAVPDEDKPVITQLVTALHGADATNAQASAAVDFYYEEIARRTEARVAKDHEFSRQTEDALRAEWGNEYVLNRNMIAGLIDTAPEGVRDLIKSARLGNGDPFLSHPAALKWLNGMAREINPPTTLVPNAGANIGNAIADELKSIEAWMGAPKGSPERAKYDDPAISGPNGRYVQLLDGQAKIQTRQ